MGALGTSFIFFILYTNPVRKLLGLFPPHFFFFFKQRMVRHWKESG